MCVSIEMSERSFEGRPSEFWVRTRTGTECEGAQFSKRLIHLEVTQIMRAPNRPESAVSCSGNPR